MRQLFGIVNKQGSIDSVHQRKGAQLVWASFPIGLALTSRIPLVPWWIEFNYTFLEATTKLALEYLLLQGTFIATLSVEHLLFVDFIASNVTLFRKKVMYVSIWATYFWYEEDTDP